MLNSGERIDDLIINNLKIIQHEKEFCFSLDAIILAHFVTLKKDAKVVDLGAGTGVIGLLTAARGAKEVVGIEISPFLSDMAMRSITLNNLSKKMRVLNADLRQVKKILPAGEWEAVVSNPPYRPLGQGYVNPNERVAMARHEVTATLADVVEAAGYLVKYRGRFAMIHLPERLPEIIEAMRKVKIEPKRLQLVYPSPERKPNMLLIEGVLGANPGLDVLPPLIIYNADGTYSQDILKFYKR